MGAGAGWLAYGPRGGCMVVGMLASSTGRAKPAGKDGSQGDGDLLSLADACRAGAGDARSSLEESGAHCGRHGSGRPAPDALLRVVRKGNPRGTALVCLGR